MNILFFDLETTGLESENNSVIQIAAEMYTDGKVVNAFNHKLQPNGNKFINLGALKVNKTKIRELKSFDASLEIVHKFADFLLDCKEKSGKEPLVVCGQNVAFDVQFLNRLFADHGIVGLNEILAYRVLDTSTIAQFLIDSGKIDLKSYNLKKLSEYFKVDQLKEGDDALVNVSYHDALYDVRMTARVYYAMRNLVQG